MKMLKLTLAALVISALPMSTFAETKDHKQTKECMACCKKPEKCDACCKDKGMDCLKDCCTKDKPKN
jgi:hypothetical protein